MTVDVEKAGLASMGSAMGGGGRLMRRAQTMGRSFGQSFSRGAQGIAKPKLAAPTTGNYRAGQLGNYMGLNRKPLSFGAAVGGGGVLAAKRDVGTGVVTGHGGPPRVDVVAELSKGILRQGTKPILARVTPAAGRNHARVITGKTRSFGKAREFDPENRRSARTGAAAGITGVSGLGLAGYGAHNIYVTGAPQGRPISGFDAEPRRELKIRGGAKQAPKLTPANEAKLREEAAALMRRDLENRQANNRRAGQRAAQDEIAQHNRRVARAPRGRYVSGRGAAAVAGGTALMGAAAGLHRRATEPRWS